MQRASDGNKSAKPDPWEIVRRIALVERKSALIVRDSGMINS